jgi:hypothetical protein
VTSTEDWAWPVCKDAEAGMLKKVGLTRDWWALITTCTFFDVAAALLDFTFNWVAGWTEPPFENFVVARKLLQSKH